MLHFLQQSHWGEGNISFSTPCFLTVHDGPAGDFPEDQTQGPDVGLLVGLEDVGANGLVQHLRGHVALGSHAGVVAHVQVVVGLGVDDCQTWQGGNKKIV